MAVHCGRTIAFSWRWLRYSDRSSPPLISRTGRGRRYHGLSWIVKGGRGPSGGAIQGLEGIGRMKRSTLAEAIRTARLASGLTQEQLGRRLGLKGRAVYRWERDASAPRRRHRSELVAAINAVNRAAAATLASVFASEAKGQRGADLELGAVALVPAPPPLPDPKLTLELAVFAMADALDVPARRLRGGLVGLIKRVREASITLDAVQRHLEERLQ